jgi:hypothetical protein
VCVCVCERADSDVWREYIGRRLCGCVMSVRACVQDGWSCLLIASEKGHLDVAKYLCEVGGERLLTLTQNVSALSSSGQMYVCGSSMQPRRELDWVRGLWVR